MKAIYYDVFKPTKFSAQFGTRYIYNKCFDINKYIIKKFETNF